MLVSVLLNLIYPSSPLYRFSNSFSMNWIRFLSKTRVLEPQVRHKKYTFGWLALRGLRGKFIYRVIQYFGPCSMQKGQTISVVTSSKSFDIDMIEVVQSSHRIYLLNWITYENINFCWNVNVPSFVIEAYCIGYRFF
jgi:hypothetical protein